MYVLMANRSKRPATEHAAHRQWLYFAGQIALVSGVELADEFIRGMIAQSDSHAGIANAARIVDIESALGLWVEPGWQQFFEHTHHVLGLTITWGQVIPVVNGIYLFGHIFITLFFALWIFLFRRRLFAFLRNVFFITNALALVLYEAFPLAPPRLTTGLHFAGLPYKFVDTMYQVLGANGKVAGTEFGYNEFAAMPSLHIGWSLIVGLSLAWTLRPWPLRLLALTYPVLMTVTVVVTGNHYLMDGFGAAGIVLLAFVGALLFQWWREKCDSFTSLLHDLDQAHHQRTAPVWRAGQGEADDETRAVA